MREHRIIMETGSGNDLFGEDYTKAACRAVQDALRHSSLILFRSLDIDHHQMRVKVTIGIQVPEKVNVQRVAAELPRGRTEVTAVKGGLNVHDPELGTTHVVATAAIEAFFSVDTSAWKLSS